MLGLATSSPAAASAAGGSSASGGASHAPPPFSPFDALTPGPDVVLTDYKKVTHSFGIVSGQVAAGLESLRSVAEFVRRVCQAKANYAAELLKTSGAFATGGPTAPSSSVLARTDKGSSKGGAGSAGDLLVAAEDAMTSSSRIWGELREQLFEEARQEQEFSALMLAEVCAPMMSFYTEATRRARVLTAHHQALAGQLRALNEGSLLQAKIASVRLLTALQAQESRERDAALAARHTNPDPLTLVPAPPVHAKGEDPNASENSKLISASKKNFEATTRKALASVGSFFKNLGKKGDKEKEKERAEKESKDSKDAAAAAAGSVAAPAEGSTASAPASASSLAIDSALAIHGGETSEELREKLYLSSLSYKLAVASSNARQDQLYSHDLPSLFVELQRLEIGRLNCLRHYLSVLAGANMSLVGPNKQRVQSLLQSVAAMHCEGDTREFSQRLIASVGEVVKPNPYAYDLPFAPEVIRGAKMDPALIAAPSAALAAAASSSSSSSSVVSPSSSPSYFTSPLAVQMDLADSAGAHHLDVPRVFSTLLAAIRLRKGYHRSTLFFTAAPVADIVALRARMESGDFETKDVSLDVLANTFKLWMRLLPEPLIPAPLYSAAIQSVKKDAAAAIAERHAAAEAAAAAQAKPPPSNQPQGASVQSLDGVERVPSASAAAAAPLSPTAASLASSSPTPDRPRSASMSSASAHLVLPPVSQSQLPSPQLHQYIQAIYSALPTLHQRILANLAALLSDLASSNSQVLVSAVPPSSPRLASPGEDQLAATGPSSVAVLSGSNGGTSSGASAGSAGAAASTVDWSRWANCMMHNAAVFAPSILRNTQGDATEVRRRGERRARGGRIVRNARMSRSELVLMSVSCCALSVCAVAAAFERQE